MDTQSSCCGGACDGDDHYRRFAELLRNHDVNAYVASVNVFAAKPN